MTANFPYSRCNKPSSLAFGDIVSHLIWYARTCSTYEQFLKRDNLLKNKLIKQDYQKCRLKSSFRKFFGQCNDLVIKYNRLFGHMLIIFIINRQVGIIYRIVYRCFRSPDQQRILAPPWHLILPIIFNAVRVCSAHVLYFSYGPLTLNSVR